MNAPPTWNRAERRRRGMTRSRMKRTGSIASAGVLVSAGLFGPTSEIHGCSGRTPHPCVRVL